MFRWSSNEKGFTLIEMLIVILIISILLLIAVPNMAKNNKVVMEKSCEATVKLIQSQVAAFQVEHERLPTNFEEMHTEGFIEEEDWKCPNEEELVLDETGKVSRPSSAP